jgi:hypothetical protein
VPNTCEWFLKHATFQKWKASSGNNLLWLSADPGCGKSVLSRVLIDENLVSAEPVTLCYFFFKDNEDQNNIATALCALLHQLLCAHDDLIQKHVASAVKHCGKALRKDDEALWRTFILAATDPSAGDVICILDALDECKESDRNKLINHLDHFYTRSVKKSKLRFLVTSRPYHDIENGFFNLTRIVPTIRLSGEEESDSISREIEIVLEDKIKNIAEKEELGEEVRSSLQKRLCEIPNRTYLWLHLIMNEVKEAIAKGKGITEKKMLKVINILPKTVEEAYEKILARCDQEATKMLEIIVAAQRPLTLREIDVALEIYQGSTSHKELDLEGEVGRKKSIRLCCGLFVSIVDSRVFLIHQTAREFLVRKNDDMSNKQGWRHSVVLQEAHRVLSEKCVTYLLFREFQQYRHSNEPNTFLIPRIRFDFGPDTNEHAFLDYSAKHWIFHVQEASISSTDWVSKTANLCDVGNGSSWTWYEIYRMSTGSHLHGLYRQSALYCAVVLGLINETAFLLNSTAKSLRSISLSPFLKEDLRDALRAATRNETHGKELMKLFINRQGGRVDITESVVVAAVKNKFQGREIITLLLNQRGDEVKITEEVVKAAVRNTGQGRELMTLLLNQRGDEVKITEEVFAVAAGNIGQGGELMKLLLNQWGDEVKITEEVAEVAAGNIGQGREVMTLLLNQRGDEVEITEEVVEAAAGNTGQGREVMTLLLNQRGDEVEITEKVVEAAGGNMDHGKEVMIVLLRQGVDKFVISADGLVTRMARYFGQEAMALFLNRWGDEVKITTGVVEAAAGNMNYGKEVMIVLLRQGVDKFVISDGLVTRMARYFGQEAMALFLNRWGDEVNVTEEVVEAAAGNMDHGKEVMIVLLRQGVDRFVISDGLMTRMARNFGQEAMALFLNRWGDEVKITTGVVEAAAGNMGHGKEVMTLLLDQRGDEVKITEEVVKAAARNELQGEEVMIFLFDQRRDEVEHSSSYERFGSSLGRLFICGKWVYFKKKRKFSPI